MNIGFNALQVGQQPGAIDQANGAVPPVPVVVVAPKPHLFSQKNMPLLLGVGVAALLLMGKKHRRGRR